MAKRSRRSTSNPRRDAPPIATQRVSRVRPPSPLPFRVNLPRRPLPHLDDRVYTPQQDRPYKTFSGRPARVVPPPLPKRAVAPSGWSAADVYRAFDSVPATLLFEQPKKTLVCVRRSIRRRVLAARGKLGANRYRKPTSSVRC